MLRLFFLCIGVCAVSAASTVTVTRGINNEPLYKTETRLKKQILNSDDYDTSVIPRKSSNKRDAVDVSIGASLVSIGEVDCKKEIVSLNVWTKLTWTDERLKWKPSDFGGVKLIRVPEYRLWIPDIALYNSVSQESTFPLKHSHARAIVYNTGKVLFVPPSTIKAKTVFNSTCEDEFTFAVRLGSWTYDGYQLNLKLYEDEDKVDLKGLIADKTYAVVSAPAHIETKYYTCCEEPYQDFRFNVTLRHL